MEGRTWPTSISSDGQGTVLRPPILAGPTLVQQYTCWHVLMWLPQRGRGYLATRDWSCRAAAPGQKQMRDVSLPRTKTAAGNLPPPDTKRWTARRKASVVEAVHSGIITIEEVCRCYTLSVAAVPYRLIGSSLMHVRRCDAVKTDRSAKARRMDMPGMRYVLPIFLAQLKSCREV